MKNSPKQLRVVTRPRSGSSATAKIAPLLSVLGCLVALLYAAPAQAQTRTWVSGVGNDANPCSRTAPCKTFAGAISKTAAGGEINCLDPGGFGGVTITKAITIACEGVTAGVLVSGTNAIIVSAGPSDQVTLRGLDINGAGTGLNGIRFLAGKALIVDNCQIYEFTTNGIDVALGATGSSLTVKDTRINNLGGVGIRVTTTVGGVSASVDHVNISRVTTGVESAAGGNTSVSNSIMFAASNGALASANGAVMTVANSVMSSNNIGANASVAGATIALTNSDLFANNTAVGAAVGSNFISGANNKLSGNASPGAGVSGTMINE
jgi:hypothetical protein